MFVMSTTHKQRQNGTAQETVCINYGGKRCISKHTPRQNDCTITHFTPAWEILLHFDEW
jgi:hypothetical protein